MEARRIVPPHVADTQGDHEPLRIELTAVQTVLGALLILREQHGHSAAVRVLRYAACYLQIPEAAVAPTPPQQRQP